MVGSRIKNVRKASRRKPYKRQPRKTTVDGRSHNEVNAWRRHMARERLAFVVRRSRKDIRQGLVLPPQTISRILDLFIVLSKEQFGTGFSKQFLYRHKSLLHRFQRFSLKYLPMEKDALDRSRPSQSFFDEGGCNSDVPVSPSNF